VILQWLHPAKAMQGFGNKLTSLLPLASHPEHHDLIIAHLLSCPVTDEILYAQNIYRALHALSFDTSSYIQTNDLFSGIFLTIIYLPDLLCQMMKIIGKNPINTENVTSSHNYALTDSTLFASMFNNAILFRKLMI